MGVLVFEVLPVLGEEEVEGDGCVAGEAEGVVEPSPRLEVVDVMIGGLLG